MRVSFRGKPVMVMHKEILKNEKVVYLLIGSKPLPYPFGKSRIVYIGTTKKGVGRIATSAAYRAKDAFAKRGVRELEVYLVSCKPRGAHWSWLKLERALLAQFFEFYQSRPKCNKTGRFKFDEALRKLFRREAINKILMHFDGEHGARA